MSSSEQQFHKELDEQSKHYWTKGDVYMKHWLTRLADMCHTQRKVLSPPALVHLEVGEDNDMAVQSSHRGGSMTTLFSFFLTLPQLLFPT
jgi:hypothetical protein